ncbi:MAG: hypothetical protein IJU12_06210 [Clostridia bacterium]|nr:hypothetical protein [Clostridia bacterium]
MRLGKEKMAIPHESFPAPWPPSEMVEVPVDAETANRNIGFCMGQVAGMAAAMAVQSDTDIRSIDVKALQNAVYPLKEA